MPVAIFDTSVLIDHLRGATEARDLLARTRASGTRVCGCMVTRTEVLGGMRAAERAGTHRLLDVLDWIPVDAAIADHAGALARTYRRSHPGIDMVDYLIAATAECLDAQLLTCNVKHFPMLDGLTRPY